MNDLADLITRIRGGDTDAYGIIVRRFQDMAVAYGYSLLGDRQAAEDASQEAFFEAFRDLASLREPAAFPGWFRRILFKQCDRIRRRREPATAPLDQAAHAASAAVDPSVLVERR
jgi:DNA-directed RNA polymerase specialized sigma24 family protein